MKRDKGSTYAVVTRDVTTAWLGREVRQLWVVTWVLSLKNLTMCCLYWNRKMMIDGCDGDG